SIVAALGGGSGVDMIALANNLADAQFQLRNERLAVRSEVLERQISAASSLKNSLSLLASALGDRVRMGDLAVTPQIANGTVAAVASPAGAAGSGSYSLGVLALAATRTLAGRAFAAATDVVGAGSLAFRFGETSGTAFAEDSAHAAV